MPRVLRFDTVSRRLSELEIEVQTYSVTSQPYPLIVAEKLDVAMSFMGAVLRDPVVLDEMGVSFAFSLGYMRQVLQNYAFTTEEMDVSMSFASGVLTRVLVTYSDWPYEGVDMTYAFGSGVLTRVLITYADWPYEGVDVAYGFVSGVLT